MRPCLRQALRIEAAINDTYDVGICRALRNLPALRASGFTGIYSPGAMTYDRRRLRLHGLIERVPDSHRYRIIPLGTRPVLRSALHARSATRLVARLVRCRSGRACL